LPIGQGPITAHLGSDQGICDVGFKSRVFKLTHYRDVEIFHLVFLHFFSPCSTKQVSSQKPKKSQLGSTTMMSFLGKMKEIRSKSLRQSHYHFDKNVLKKCSFFW